MASAIRSGKCDIDQVPAALQALVAAIPPPLKPLAPPDAEAYAGVAAECIRRLKESRADATPADETVVYGFLTLFSLLMAHTDEKSEIPPYTSKEVMKAIEPASTELAEMNLSDRMPEVSRIVEYSLHALGHRHQQDQDAEATVGLLDEERADAALAVLRDSWGEHAEELETWLVPYLVFRLVEVLSSLDMFHAMYGGIPRYTEFKIAGYLLWLTGRGKYKPASDVAKVAHKLLHLIQTRCRKAIDDEEGGLPALQAAIGQSISTARSALAAQRETIKHTKGLLEKSTLSVFATFMESYVQELQETGQFHAAMWKLPMFEDVRDVFTVYRDRDISKFSILLIGETGTGKESIAKLFLGRLGRRYVALNCAGIGWDVMSLDLRGLLAEEGTSEVTGALLLDEIEKSHLDAQGGLLRLLDKPQGEYRVPGDAHAKPWEGATVATSTELLFERVNRQEFLPDLLWRFDERIRIRPLRDMAKKPAVFKELLGIGLQTAAYRYGMRGTLRFTTDQENELLAYNWPGNLRELLTLTSSVASTTISRNKEHCLTPKALDVPDDVFRKLMTRASDVAARCSREGASPYA